MSGQTTFTVEQAVRVQRDLRSALGLGDEVFPLPAFVGMISDEIEQMRANGRPDRELIEIIQNATGQPITIQDLERFYVPPDMRRRA